MLALMDLFASVDHTSYKISPFIFLMNNDIMKWLGKDVIFLQIYVVGDNSLFLQAFN